MKDIWGKGKSRSLSRNTTSANTCVSVCACMRVRRGLAACWGSPQTCEPGQGPGHMTDTADAEVMVSAGTSAPQACTGSLTCKKRRL